MLPATTKQSHMLFLLDGLLTVMCSCFVENFPLSGHLLRPVVYRGSDTVLFIYFPCPKYHKYQETSNWNFWFYV